jgi:glycine/D-amino acid oxidase-like deaminating enzyme
MLKSSGISKESLKIEYNWTGIMGFTVDNSPMIGPLNDREYIVAGFSGIVKVH